MDQDKILYIKKDAKIPLVIGAGFMSRLQQALIFLAEEKTTEEVEAFNQALTAQVPLEGWMLHYETIALLIKGIEDAAHDNGLTVEEDMPTS